MDLGRRASWQLAVLPHEDVVCHVVLEHGADLRAAFRFPNPGAFVLEDPGDALGEDVVLPAAFASHALLDAAPAQVVPETARRVLRPLVAVEDRRAAVAGAGLGKGVREQFGIRRVRQPDADDQAREHFDDDCGIHLAAADAQQGQVAGPKYVSGDDPSAAAAATTVARPCLAARYAGPPPPPSCAGVPRWAAWVGSSSC